MRGKRSTEYPIVEKPDTCGGCANFQRAMIDGKPTTAGDCPYSRQMFVRQSAKRCGKYQAKEGTA